MTLEPAKIKISAHLRVDAFLSDCSLSNWYALKFLNFSSFDMRFRHSNPVLILVCTETVGWQLFLAPGVRMTSGKARKIIHRRGASSRMYRSHIRWNSVRPAQYIVIKLDLCGKMYHTDT